MDPSNPVDLQTRTGDASRSVVPAAPVVAVSDGGNATRTDAHNEPLGQAAKPYPSLEAAQVFVLPSYQWLITRIEAAESRIQSMLTFIATVTFGIPTVSRTFSSTVDFVSFWFILAMVLAALAFVIGLVSRLSGKVTVVDPGFHFQQSLEMPEQQFKLETLYFAGQHMERNSQLLKRKATGVMWMTGCFLLELASLFVWAMRS